MLPRSPRPLPRLNTVRTPAGEDSCGETRIRATTCAYGLGCASKQGATIGGLRSVIAITIDAPEPDRGSDRVRRALVPAGFSRSDAPLLALLLPTDSRPTQRNQQS